MPVCTNNSVWLLVWFVRSAVTFQTFCSGLGFYETHHLKDKISLRHWPFPLFGVHFKHLLFVVTRFMVGAHLPSVRLSLHRGAERSLWEGNSSRRAPQTPHDKPARITYTGWTNVRSDNGQTSREYHCIKSFSTCWVKILWFYFKTEKVKTAEGNLRSNLTDLYLFFCKFWIKKKSTKNVWWTDSCRLICNRVWAHDKDNLDDGFRRLPAPSY